MTMIMRFGAVGGFGGDGDGDGNGDNGGGGVSGLLTGFEAMILRGIHSVQLLRVPLCANSDVV